MKTKRTLTNLPVAAVFGILLQLSASAVVQVNGVSSGTDADYAADASSTDLVNTGAPSLASAPTYSSALHFGPAENDGTVGAANATGDITFWLGASGGSTYSITFALDISVNTLGYDIESIQTIHGWTNNSGNQKNQNYVVAVSTVGDAGFTDIATVAYLPFTSAGNTASTKVNITEDATGILASKVDEIRFTYTVPASGGQNASPVIREIDVFGTPTSSGNDPFAITEIEHDPDAAPSPTVTLTWRSRAGTTYKALSSTDLGDWSNELADSLGALQDEKPDDGNHLTVTFKLEDGLEQEDDLFFRVEEEQGDIAPSL